MGGELVDISVEIDGWTVLPIADQGSTTHLIATRDDDEALFTDIDVVLYERLDDGWAATAYDPQVTKEDAMMDLASEFGLADPMSGEWQIDLDEEDFLGYILPRVPFGKGFFVTDPLHDIAQQLNDAEPLAEGAEAAGLPAGSSAINTGTVTPIGGGNDVGDPQPGGGGDGCGCEDACIQESIGSGVDAALSDPTLDLESIEEIAFDDLQSMLGCCIRWTWTSGATTCTCTPTGGWTPAGSYVINVMGGQRLICKYTRPVTKTCTRKRVRRCWDCSRTTTVQTRTITGTQTASSMVNFQNPPVPPCPGPPGVVCATTGATTSTAWTPAPPACP